MPELPTEIIADILSRLPPKPLCRFKCVAKSWNSLINSPIFIKLHLNQSLISQNPNLLICQDSLSTAEIPTSNPNNLNFSALNHPVNHLPNNPTVQVLGYCNGIFCISDRFKKTVFFYNPVTKTHRLIPPAPTRFPVDDHPLLTYYNPFVYKEIDNIVVFGFGYDDVSDDYKLLRVIEGYKDRVQIDREVRLFSLRNNSWKCVNDDLIDYPHQRMDGVLVNGVLYFVVSDENGKHMVKCFDLTREMFSIFDLFDYDKSFGNLNFVLKELGGCFCVMVNYKKRSPSMLFGCRFRLLCSDLWVMKEYGRKESWVRVFSIPDPVMVGSWSNICPVAYSKDGKKILLELDGTQFCWYDWCRKECEWVIARGLQPKEDAFDTYTFVGSLVLLKTDKEKAIDEEKLRGKSMPPKKNINKKNLDGFLSTGFKLRL